MLLFDDDDEKSLILDRASVSKMEEGEMTVFAR